ncbi:MAG: ostA-like family protein [Rhodospirillales bacterium]|nr:ostA-like family protein [Rhodospirillales bacterium]
MRFLIFNFLIVFFLAVFPAAAQNAGGFNPQKDEPLEITADQTLEWHRDTQQFIARGAVVAKQGDVIIHAEVLTADYRETEDENFDIYRLTAAGNVEIESRGNKAYGDKTVYNVDQGVAVMTGENLRLVSPDQTVTARDSFEYWINEGRLTALGDAKAIRGEDTITAARLAAFFTKGADGKNQLNRLEAYDNVVIITPTETLSGQKGVYNAATNVAELIGTVKIQRGPNVLEGDRADVNLATNVSRMHGSPETGGRVHGTFYPGSDKTQP